MSMGPLGVVGGAAGSPYVQRTGSDKERAATEANDQARLSQSQKSAQAAAGVGKTDEDQKAGDRDADGRRLWERPPEGAGSEEAENETENSETENIAPQSSGDDEHTGGHLDLTA